MNNIIGRNGHKSGAMTKISWSQIIREFDIKIAVLLPTCSSDTFLLTDVIDVYPF